MESLHFYWEYRRAKMRQLDYHLSYHASDADDSYSHRPEVIRPLYYSLDPYDFYRVEGHISRSFIALNQKVGASPAEALQFMVKRYNLDFEVVEVDIYCNQCRFLSQKYPYPNLSPAEFFNSFREDIMGAEHLAGVPKGGTFIVVTTKMVLDDVSQTVAIADFALPYRCCPQKPILCRFDLAVKMAGNCAAGKRELYITVVPSNLTTGRFLMTIDDSPLEGTIGGTTTRDGMFDYQNGQAITITTQVAADNQKHKIKVKDPSLDCCGEIIVLVPDCVCKINLQANVAPVCIEGYREIDVVISAINQGTKGFNLKVDGSIYEENATYEPDGITTKTVAIAGDGEDHEIKVTDVENPNCEGILTVRVPDCRHIISVSAVSSDVCLQDNMTSVEVIITTKNPPPFGEFKLKYDGNLMDVQAPSNRRARSRATAAASAGDPASYIAAGSMVYEASGSNILSINVKGDSQKHLLEVIDTNDPSIHAFTEFLVKDCQDIIVN
ncbi:MAG: hypothetical protein H7246_03380 [Phycisphaerae bacterium]|nr:hypothetical protein [Saprospiraceae bacterium]